MQARFMIALVAMFVMFASSNGFAAIYKYIDENGQVSIADDLQSIPEQYRETAVIVSGAVEEEEQKPLYRNLPQKPLETRPVSTALSPVREPSTVEDIKTSFSMNKVMISLLVVVSAVFAFVVLGILDADHKKSVKIVRVAILWGMSVYLIYAHAGDVGRLFRSTKDNFDSAQQESVEKGEKAAKALKEMNALIENIDHPGSQDHESDAPDKSD
jgi:hypothetical protein